MTAGEALTLDLTDAPDGDDIALVERELVAFNVARSLPYDRRPLCVFLRDRAGRAVGGVTGYTNWGWLSVDCFWLPEGLRSGGAGGRLLAEAEAEALRRGCRHARLFTYAFQAQGFCGKHGYAVFGMLDDDPPGHRQVWLRKGLSPDGSGPVIGPRGVV